MSSKHLVHLYNNYDIQTKYAFKGSGQFHSNLWQCDMIANHCTVQTYLTCTHGFWYMLCLNSHFVFIGPRNMIFCAIFSPLYFITAKS